MILPRTLYNDSPPERRTRVANNPTLLFSWWCTIFSVVIIGFRVFGRYSRNKQLFREDKIMALSIIPLVLRMAFVHVVLIYGTNNVDTAGLTDPARIHRREIGSRMVLGARIFYALFIWTAKFTVSEFLKRMTDRFWKKGYEMGLRCIRVFLLVTFVAVVIATLGECQPFSHYWQVIPDPGPQCRQGYAHLLTMGVTDVTTDILLIVFPIPIILRSGMPLRRKVSLIALFSLSIVLIGITAARIPSVIKRGGLQQFRTVFASGEILAAAAVSNVIILGSFLRDRGVKKQKYKFGSTTDSMERRSSTRRPTLQQWGSDEDLIRDIGIRLDPEIHSQQGVPRPAPVANLDLLSRHHGTTSNFPRHSWTFPPKEPDTDSTVSRSNQSEKHPGQAPIGPREVPRMRRVSFFDVGGLLEAGSQSTTSSPSPTDSVLAQDFAHPRRESGTRSFVTDGEGHLLPPPRGYPVPSHRRPSRVSQQSSQLQDVGNLLPEDPEPVATAPSATSPPLAVTHQTPEPVPSIEQITQSPNNQADCPTLQDAGNLLSSKSSSP